MPAIDRRAIWERDSRECQLCGTALAYEDMEVDHIVPRARGGLNTSTNLRATHRRCNQERGYEYRRRYAFPRNWLPHTPTAPLDLDEAEFDTLYALARHLGLSRPATVQAAIHYYAEYYGVAEPQRRAAPAPGGTDG